MDTSTAEATGNGLIDLTEFSVAELLESLPGSPLASAVQQMRDDVLTHSVTQDVSAFNSAI